MKNLTFWNIRVWACIAIIFVGFKSQEVLASSPINLDLDSPAALGIDPVIFTFNCLDGAPGDTVCIPVTVENFEDIAIFQFEIIWESDVLDFLFVRNPGTPSINPVADFNLSGPNSLKVIPLGFPINGESLPDGTVLFEICFRVIGTPGSTSTVGISPYFEFEAVNDIGSIPVDSNGCQMTVNNAVDLVGFITSCGPAIAGGNGNIDVSVFGGTAPYNITWVETVSGTPGGPIGIPAEGGAMVINVPEGNYDITITDASGGTVTYNINVDPLALSVTTVLRHPTCYKFENGTMWIKPSGGSAPFSYIWESLTDPLQAGSGFIRNPGDSSLVTSLPSGSYNLLVKDDNGCEVESVVVLNYNPFVFTITDIQDASCNGATDGVIDISISGGTPFPGDAYTVTISPSFEVSTNSVSIGLLGPGTYSITVADAVSQCDTVYTFTIGATTVISGNILTSDPACANASNGSVTVSGLTNGTPGVSYTYTIVDDMGTIVTTAPNFPGMFTYASLAAGDYFILIEEGPCISDSIPFTILDAPGIVVSVAGSRPDNCIPTPTGDVWFNITNGTGPYLLSSTGGTQDGDTLENMNGGNYILTVTDANGCTATLPFVVPDGDDNEEADLSFSFSGVPCEDGSTITVLYQGGPIPAGAGVTWGSGEITPTISFHGPGIYSATVFLPAPIFCILDDTAVINCQTHLDIDVTVIQPVCNDEAVGGPFTGTVIVDTSFAVAPVTFYWSFPDTTTTGTYSGLAPGIYYVTVTDAVDSMAIDTFEILAPDAIHFNFGSPQHTSCPDICDGAVDVTPIDGDPALDYFLYWTTTSPQGDTGISFQINDLCAGVTTFSVSQDGICFYEGDIEIEAPDSIEIDLVNAVDVTCYGGSDGNLEVAAVNGTPGYTYTWLNGPSTPVFNNLAEGEYFVTATDSRNCTAVDSFTISQPDTLIAQIDSSATKNLSCGASDDGIVTVNVSGGNAGSYSFQWNPDVSSIYQAVNLAADHYFITVTDSKGCSDTTSFLLTSPPPIVVEWPAIIPPGCYGEETMLQIDNVTGGSGNYSFNINGGQSFDLGEPVLIPSGIYIISVFDDRGCSSDSIYTVMEPNPIIVAIGPDNPVIDLGDSLFLVGTVVQSDNPIAMTNWAAETPVSCLTCYETWVYNVLPTVYTWTVTDVNGCQGSSSIMVGVDLERDVFIPNAFSPNNDGRNDDFRIYTGAGVVSINYFNVYDRWGNLVHSETNLLPHPDGAGNWDGSYDGKKLNPGVYVYVAEVEFIDNGTKLLYRGDVTLLK